MIKKNFLTKDEIVVCPTRTKRPSDVVCDNDFLCPFCPQNSHLITDSIFSYFDDEIKIIENKYPLVQNEKNVCMHQVIIDTKSHFKQMQDFCPEHMFYLMKSIKQCFLYFSNIKSVKYVQIFKNFGINSGASLKHSHWQAIALDHLPKKTKSYIKLF